MKRHLTIRKIDIKNEKSFSTVELESGEDREFNRKFKLSLTMELETSGNFEEFWNEDKPNKINLFVLNAILKNMGIDPNNPVYKIDL